MEEASLPLASWLALAHEADEFLGEAPTDPAERARAASLRFGIDVTPAQAAALDAAGWTQLVMRQLGPRS